jgi:peptidoglycan biosynthesis protein MviN/MurJ (putative lipid II flippase)
MKPMSRHAILTAISYLTLGIVSALYGLLILRFFANRPIQSDAFFLAYTVFSAVAMFSATLRISVVPMLVREGPDGRDPTGRYGEAALAIGGSFLAIALAVAVLGIPFGRLLGYGLSAEGQRLTGLILVAFAPVIFLQGAAQLLSAALTARGRLDFVSVTAALSSILGLIVFLLTTGAGILSVVLGLAVTNLLFAGAEWLRAKQCGLRVSGEDWRQLSATGARDMVGGALRSSSLYIAFNLAYIVSQSLTTTFPAGMPTAFAYAYTLTALAVSATAGSLGITLVVRYRDYAAGPLGAFREYVLEHGAMAGLIASGVLGALAVLALPIGYAIFALLPAGELPAAVQAQRVAAFAHSIWAIAIAGWGLSVFGVLAPAAVAARQDRLFVPAGIAIMGLHFVVGVSLKRGLGLAGVGLGLSLTGILFAALAAWSLRRIFEEQFLTNLAKRLMLPLAAGALAAGLGVAALRILLPHFGWVAASAGSLVVFAPLFLVATGLIERRAWMALLSHVRFGAL